MNIKNGFIQKSILVIFCFILYFAWSLSQPYNTCPDERMRYEIVTYIFENNELPVEGDESLRDSIFGFSYATSPPLPYILGAVFMKLTSLFFSSDFALLMGARMISILAGVGFVIIAIKIADLLFSNKTGKWCFILLCAFWPQVAFLFTYFNCDALALFFVALVLYFIAKGIHLQWKISDCIGLAIAISLCILTYYNTLGIILCSIFVFFTSNYLQHKPVKIIIKKTLYIVSVVIILTGWFFIRNALLYHGDFLGLTTTRAFGEMYGITGYTPSERAAKGFAQMTSIHGLLYWFVISAKSFIGFFGKMDIPLKEWMYQIYYIIIFLGCFGFFDFIRYRIKNKEAINEKTILAIGMFLCAIVTFILSLYYSFSDFQPQGRYLMPGFLSVVWFLSVGLNQVHIYAKKLHFQIAPIIAIATLIIIIGCLTQIIIKIY